jgi:DNA primase
VAHIPDELIEEIRERTDIIQVIGESVQLKKSGINWKGLCPFHQEKSPSFHVNPARHSFYCFGCQKKGDVYNFLMELHGKSFGEVVRELAARVQVVIPERPESPQDRERRSERERMFDVNRIAARFYRDRLEAGWKYLRSRGIGEQIAETFQLGCAPDDWDQLARHLEQEKVSIGLATQLGLIAPRKGGGGHYDKFRHRLMCPVILPAGEIAGFSGRTLGSDPEIPKYTNSPESPIYRKSHLLFGLHAARPAFHKKGRAILVEGNFDVVAMHQAGFTETVAPLGTALTPEQVEVLRRLADTVLLCFDGDKAGRAAVLRAIPMLVTAGIESKVVRLPEGEDPDTLVRKGGPEALEKALGEARPVVDAFLDDIWFRTERSAEQRSAALKESAPLLASVSDPIRREVLIDQFSRALGVEARVVKMVIQSGSAAGPRATQTAAPPAGPPPAARLAPPPSMELKIFGILSDHPDLAEAADKLGIGSLLTDVRLRDMYLAARKGRSFLDAAAPDIRDLVAREVLSGQYVGVKDPRRLLAEAAQNLQVERLIDETQRLARAAEDAARRGDDAALVRELQLKKFETEKRAKELRAKRPEEEPR